MLYFVYYHTRKKILRHYICESPKALWETINNILDKGYTVTEIDDYTPGHGRAIYSLGFDLQGEPKLIKCN